VAIAEPFFLLAAPKRPAGFALVVLAVQAAGALVAFVLALRPERSPPSGTTTEPDPAATEPDLVPASSV
jgi:hypothetical protein